MSLYPKTRSNINQQNLDRNAFKRLNVRSALPLRPLPNGGTSQAHQLAALYHCQEFEAIPDQKESNCGFEEKVAYREDLLVPELEANNLLFEEEYVSVYAN